MSLTAQFAFLATVGGGILAVGILVGMFVETVLARPRDEREAPRLRLVDPAGPEGPDRAA